MNLTAVPTYNGVWDTLEGSFFRRNQVIRVLIPQG